MFAGWNDFYVMLGAASASLIGLLFVVSTLTAGLERPSARGVSLFLTPTVFKFAVVLALSATALAPGLPETGRRWLLGAIALIGLVNLTSVTVSLWRGDSPGPLHWSDPWCYGVAPTLIFLGLGAAAACPEETGAARGVAATALLLLLLGVRNAWDLVTTLAPQVGRRLSGVPVAPPGTPPG